MVCSELFYVAAGTDFCLVKDARICDHMIIININIILYYFGIIPLTGTNIIVIDKLIKKE